MNIELPAALSFLERVSVYVLSGLFLLLLFLAIFYYYQYGDDFVFLLGVKKYGVFGNMIFKYMNWDGRHLSFGGFVQMLYFKFLSPQASLILGITFLIFSLKVFLYYLDIVFVKNSFFIVFTFFMIGMLPFYKEVVIWQTGVVYLVFIFQSCLSLVIYKKYGGENIIPFLFILFLSLNTQNFNFFVASIVFFIALFKKKFKNCKSEFFVILAIVLGTVVVSIAPGNLDRIEYQNDRYKLIDPLYLIFAKFIWKSLLYSKYLFIAGVFSSFFVSVDTRRSKFDYFILISAALCSLIPFIFIPESLDVRIIFPIGFLLFFLGIFFGELLNIKNYLLFRIFKVTFLFGGCVFLFYQVLLLKEHSAFIMEREKYLLGLEPNSDAVYKYPAIPSDLIITRSPTYEDLWGAEFLEFYRLNSFKQYY